MSFIRYLFVKKKFHRRNCEFVLQVNVAYNERACPSSFSVLDECSRMDQVKFVEDSLYKI